MRNRTDPRPARPGAPVRGKNARPDRADRDARPARGETDARASRKKSDTRPSRGAKTDARPARGVADPRPGRPTSSDRSERARPDARPPRSKDGARPDTRSPRASSTESRPLRAKAGTRVAGDTRRPRPERAAAEPAPPRERPHVEGEPARIAKLLARAGIASRRDIERMIADRRIAIDGVALETPATILTSLKGVTVDGQPVAAPAAARLYLYHKPAGLLTAANDPAGRPTIYDRLPKGLPRLMPVGRLDLNTEGLLLLTNDGELKRQLELPATGIERTYRARIFGEVSQETLEGLIEGVEIEGMRYGPIDANLERRTGRNGWVEMKLKEGKNREVRRVLEYLGVQVSRLIRTAYGPFVLGDLPSGAVGEVERNELFMFRRMLHEAPN